MNGNRAIGIGCILATLAMGLPGASAMDKPVNPATPLTPTGENLRARYADMLKTLQAEVGKALPVVDEQKKSALLKAREAVKRTTVEGGLVND